MKKLLTFGIAGILIASLASCSQNTVVTYPVVNTITDNSNVYHMTSCTFTGSSFTASGNGASCTFTWNLAIHAEGLAQIVSQFVSHYDNQVALSVTTPNGNFDLATGQQPMFAQYKTDGYGKKTFTTTTWILMTNQNSPYQTDTIRINATQQ